MKNNEYYPYEPIVGWMSYPISASKNGRSGVEGPILWIIRHVRTESGLEATLSFHSSTSNSSVKELMGNWLIKGVLSFQDKTSSSTILQVNFACNQTNPAVTFDSTSLEGKDVFINRQYTELVGMGVLPRPNYNNPTVMTDVCLVVGENRLHLSKTVLAHYSEFFKAMFFGNFPESSKKEVEIKEVDGDDFIALLDLCFGSHLIRRPFVEKLLKLADRFAMPIALQRIEAFILVTDFTDFDFDNIRLIQVADQYKFTSLMTQVLSKFTLQDYKKLMKSSSVYNISRDSMVAVMKRVESLCPA